MSDTDFPGEAFGTVSREFFCEPEELKGLEKEMAGYHFPECMVPPYVKDDYNKFIAWCHKKGVKEVGHAVVPLVSSKLRAKPVNLKEFSKSAFTEGSELDGSSFATGGGRVVHRSMVRANPDKNSIWFMFPDPLRRGTLYIMSDMETPNGDAMCARKPLNLALKKLNDSISSLISVTSKKKLGKYEKYTMSVGYEKEFFIIPKESADNRLDIKYIGQTIVGGPGPINQNLQGVYLTIPKRKEEALLNEIVRDLALVGITAVQKHLEVGQTGDELNGRQCEVVLKYKDAMEATDCDLIARQIIEDVCDRNGFRAMIGSKSFTEDAEGHGINGSGKHTNMSLCRYHSLKREITENLFESEIFKPSNSNEYVNLIGLAMLAAMGRHWSVFESSIASRGNDLRRRPGFEAPVYLSAFIGNTSEFRDSLLQERNRSVSLGLSGCKIEWRTPGANTPMHYPLAFVSIAVTEVIDEITAKLKDELKKGKTLQDAIDSEYARLRKEVDYFIVNEDVYELSVEEAEKRFCCKANKNTPEALEALDSQKNTEFLVKSKIFSEEQVKAFKMVQLENYIKRVQAEAQIMASMSKILSNKVFRSAIMQRYSRELFDIDPRLKQRQDYLGGLNADLLALIDSSYLEDIYSSVDITDLKTIMEGLKDKSTEEASKIITDELLPHLFEIRKLYESIVDIVGGGEEVMKL